MITELYVAARECPVVAALHKAGETPESIILMLVKLKNQLLKDVEVLKLMVPKRIRMRDGRLSLWRCPEELIPVQEFDPSEVGKSLWELPFQQAGAPITPENLK